MNDKNIQFYNNLGVDPFKKLSEVGGFNTYKDLEVVYPYIDHAGSIVELGAGYGRCLDFFIRNNFEGKLVAVEKAIPYLNYLQENYSDRVEIINEDIKKLSLQENADVILWMFSGIIDFSRDEQIEAIKRLYLLLNPGGKLVIDIPRLDFKTYAHHKDEQNLKFDSQYGLLECYIPSMEDMIDYQKLAGFANFIRLGYATTTNKERTIYILTK